MTGESSDGVLTAEQMRRCLFAEMKNNYVDTELNEMLKALDQDNDGKIKVDDFVRLLTNENSIIKDDRDGGGSNLRCGDSCVILWEMTGKSSNGVLTTEQMRRCLFVEMRTKYNGIELNEMLKALDQDIDGKGKFSDFIRLLTCENFIIKDDRDGSRRCGSSCIHYYVEEK